MAESHLNAAADRAMKGSTLDWLEGRSPQSE
jgi:hypothetical protein